MKQQPNWQLFKASLAVVQKRFHFWLIQYLIHLILMFYLCYYNKLSVSKRVKHGLILLLLMPNLTILAILVLPGPQDINKQVGT